MSLTARGGLYSIKKVLTQLSLPKELGKEKEKLVERIIKNIQNDNIEEARQLLRNNDQEDIMEELVRKTINSRCQTFVQQLTKTLSPSPTTSDSVDGVGNLENDMFDEEKTRKRNFKALISGIIQATMNDDPKTVDTILSMIGTSVLEYFNNPGKEKRQSINPMIIACVEDFYRCVKVLFRYGFRIHIFKEDQEQIDELFQMSHVVANDFHLYYQLYFGSKHVNLQAEIETRKLRRQTSLKKHTNVIYLDPVDRFLKFKAYASPTYISLTYIETPILGDHITLSANDPVRKAFACATYSKYLATSNATHSDEYEKVGKACITFTEELLDHCEDMEEVKLILNYSNSDNLEECENANWNIALWEGHKKFVGHHFYQQFIWEKMTGDNFDWCNYFFFWKILLIPAYLLLFLLYPFIICIDLFREADILFVAPTMKENQVKKKISTAAFEALEISLTSTSLTSVLPNEDVLLVEHPVFAFFRRKIHRPFFRVFVHITIEALFIISLIYSLVDPKDLPQRSQIHFYDVSTYGLFLSFLVEDVVEVCRVKWKFFSSFWNAYSFLTHILFAIGGGLQVYGFGIQIDDNRNNWSGNHPANIGATLFAIAATMAVARSIRWFLLLREVGPVIICVIRVIKDVAIIFILFLILYIGFSLAMYAMYKPFRGDQARYPAQTLNSATATFSALFWRFFDPGEPDAVTIMKNLTEMEKTNWKVNLCNTTDPTLDGLVRLNLYENSTMTIESFSEMKSSWCKKLGKADFTQNDTFNNAIQSILDKEKVQSLEFSHFIGIAFWAVYQGIVAIILINVLIALMNTTYTKISQDSDIEWKYSKSFMYAQFLPTRAALPPPFRWFYYLACLVRWAKSKRSNLRAHKIENSDKQKYFELLSKLVKTKMQLDIENLVEDEFDDLRKDFRNIINNDVLKKIEDLEQKSDELNQNLQTVINNLKVCQDVNQKILESLQK